MQRLGLRAEKKTQLFLSSWGSTCIREEAQWTPRMTYPSTASTLVPTCRACVECSSQTVFRVRRLPVSIHRSYLIPLKLQPKSPDVSPPSPFLHLHRLCPAAMEAQPLLSRNHREIIETTTFRTDGKRILRYYSLQTEEIHQKEKKKDHIWIGDTPLEPDLRSGLKTQS